MVPSLRAQIISALEQVGFRNGEDLIKTVRGKGLFVTAPEERMSGA